MIMQHVFLPLVAIVNEPEHLKSTTLRNEKAYWVVSRKPVRLFRTFEAVGEPRRWVFVGTHRNLGFAGSPPTGFLFLQLRSSF